MTRVLSPAALNRALLSRQQLLRRSRRSLPDVLERIGGIQAQYAPSMYIGLWSRVDGFVRPALDRALIRRRVVQGTLMRSTIHLVSAKDRPLLAAGIRAARRQWFLRVTRDRGFTATDYARAASLVAGALGDGPRKRVELIAVLEDAGYGRAVWEGVGHWLEMIRVPPSGTWDRRRADLYGLAEAGGLGGDRTPDEAAGLEHLLRRYLGGFGPAALGEAADWAGVPESSLRAVADRMPLRRFGDGAGGELLDLPRALLPDPDTPAPVRLLPTWDATLLAHARRARVLPEEHRGRVFSTKNPHSVGTFLVDGSVAGSWRHVEGAIRLEPFHPIPRRWRRDLDEEAARLAAWYDG